MTKGQLQEWLEHAKVSCPTCPHKHNLSSMFIEAVISCVGQHVAEVIGEDDFIVGDWTDTRNQDRNVLRREQRKRAALPEKP